jgi:AraC-like DNA-binding protein
MDMLTKHIRQKRLVADYADLLSISPNHLNKVIRTRTGKSPSVWIDERIVLEAKVLLFQSNLTVAQIAADLGFDDQSNFGKLFRKHAGTSPANFRKLIGTNQFLTDLA